MTEPARDPDIHTLAPELKSRMEALRPSEDSFLPHVVVEMQKTLAQFTANELMHLIVGGAVQLAARNVAAPGPNLYLESAAASGEGMSGDAWRETVGPEVRRLCHETWTEHGHAPTFEEPAHEPEPEAAIETASEAASEESPDVVAAPSPPDA